MAERWKGLSLKTEVSTVVNENAEKMADKNDPYFKSQKSAEAYSRWKKRLHPETPDGISNMNITGYYHGQIEVQANGTTITIRNSAPFAASAETKNRGKLLGLNKDSSVLAWRMVLRGPTIVKIKQLTGCG